MTRKEAVSFIRNTLGCQCPDDVLCAVSRENWENPDLVCHFLQEVNPDLSALVLDVIVVGGKLIVLICGDLGPEELEMVLDAGVSVRDKLGHDRLRIAYKEKPPGFKTTENLLNEYDGRVHLHSLGELRG